MSQLLPRGFPTCYAFSLYPTHFPRGSWSHLKVQLHTSPLLADPHDSAGPSSTSCIHTLPSQTPLAVLVFTSNTLLSLLPLPEPALFLSPNRGLAMENPCLPTLHLHLTKFFSFLKLLLQCTVPIQSSPISSPPPCASPLHSLSFLSSICHMQN